MKRWTGIVMSFLMIFSMLFQGLSIRVYAAGSAVDAKITNFQVLNTSDQPVTETEKSATLKLDFNFEIPEPIFLDDGNYFDIKIPEEFDLTTAVTYPVTFDIKDEDGTVVGTATIQPNAATATGGGGNVHVVFNENAIGKYKFKGHLYFDSKINKNRVGDNQTINVKTEVNNRENLTPGPKPITVKPDHGLSTVEVIGKWAKAPTVPNQASWGVRINRTKQDLKDVVITDKITSNNGHFIDPDPLPTVITSENFKLMKCDYDAAGNPTSYTGEVVDISDKITFNEDKTEFKLDLGDIGTQSYFLSYRSTVEYGDIVQANNATLTSSTNPTQSSSGTWKYRRSGGEAIGVLAKRLKLRKVDVDDNTPLAGATFKVTKSDGASFNLTTGTDGTVISDQLMQGRYKVKEITAPEGYELDPNEYSVYVYDDVGGTLTVKDKMDKTSVKVSKEWVGPKGSSATIHLWADGVDTGKSVTLNDGSKWEYTFTGLKKNNTDGSEIQYTVKEDAITNYDSSVTGDMTSGYKVKNTNTEKVNVPVKKQWVGTPGESVTVKLLADGNQKDTAEITADDNWNHTFSNLPKYADDGHEIAYTIEEVKIDGYNSVISGNAENGFTITNTITGKVSIPVTKTWVGKEVTSATIHLYADDVEVDSIILNTGNNWQYTFTNLEKYKDGKEIKYTIKEDSIENYKSEITGDMSTGFTVKNTNTEKISVPVKKVWVGKEADSATIKLLADGTEKESVTLTKDDNWTHTFSNLPKYDENDGHEIVYTLDEVKVEGYKTGISGTAETGFTVTNTITGKVSVPVTKTWVGKEGTSATIHLFADGEEVDSITLNKDNSWQHTFTDLEKYRDGKEIEYTIKEDKIENYKSEITGDVTSGFVVKNTNTEKVSVPVVKQWVGKPTDKVEVKLLADNVEKETITLTANTNWKYEFKDLSKYDENDGHEIVYTIQEVKVDGYTTGISGTAKDGFTITNTITGKVSVPVTKKWIGTPADSITVNLYADGKKIDSQKLSKDNNWQYTFKALEQYKDGKEIEYTIEEEKVSGYTTTITGDSKNGFVITNTKDTPPTPKKPSNPKTGDSSNIGFYTGLLLLSGTLLTFLGLKRRKETQAE